MVLHNSLSPVPLSCSRGAALPQPAQHCSTSGIWTNPWAFPFCNEKDGIFKKLHSMGTWAGEPQLPGLLKVLLLLTAVDWMASRSWLVPEPYGIYKAQMLPFYFSHVFVHLVVVFVVCLFSFFFMMEKQTKEFLDFKDILEMQPLMLHSVTAAYFAIREILEFTLAEDVSRSVQIHSNLWHIWKAVAINLLKLPLLLCYTSSHFHAHCSPTLLWKEIQKWAL